MDIDDGIRLKFITAYVEWKLLVILVMTILRTKSKILASKYSRKDRNREMEEFSLKEKR